MHWMQKPTSGLAATWITRKASTAEITAHKTACPALKMGSLGTGSALRAIVIRQHATRDFRGPLPNKRPISAWTLLVCPRWDFARLVIVAHAACTGGVREERSLVASVTRSISKGEREGRKDLGNSVIHLPVDRYALVVVSGNNVPTTQVNM